jgi:hypothetical protein
LIPLEAVLGQAVLPADQAEAIARNDQPEVAGFCTDAAVAPGNCNVGACRHLETNLAAVASTAMQNPLFHGWKFALLKWLFDFGQQPETDL